MLKKYLLPIFLGGFLLAVIFSCEKSTKDEGPKNDPEAIEALVSYYSSIFKADVFDTIKDTTSSPAFYREITKRDYFIKIDIFDAPPETIYTKYARVVLTDSIEGVFHLFLNDKEYQKNLKVVSKVEGYFERWGEPWDDFRGWLLKRVAGNKIYSVPGISGSMMLRLSSTSGDYTLSPDQIISLTKIREMRAFGAGDSLTFKIFEPDTSRLFYLHYWKEGDYRKRPFVVDGDSLISGCQINGSGYQHLYIDILDYNTVHDSTAAYKSYSWGILFKVQ
jgi:hypothetical protein